MTLRTHPDTLTAWARRHPRAIMALAMLAAFALALTIHTATRNLDAAPIYWSPDGYGITAHLEDTVPVTKAGMIDNVQLWTYEGKPQDHSQCVKTGDVVLCSYKRSAVGLAGERVTR